MPWSIISYHLLCLESQYIYLNCVWLPSLPLIQFILCILRVQCLETQFWLLPYLKNILRKSLHCHLCCLPNRISPLRVPFKILHDLASTHFQIIFWFFPFMDSMFSASPSQLINLCLEYSSPALPIKCLSTLHDPAHKASPRRSSLSHPNLHSILYFSCGPVAFCLGLQATTLILKSECESLRSRKDTLHFLPVCSLRSL